VERGWAFGIGRLRTHYQGIITRVDISMVICYSVSMENIYKMDEVDTGVPATDTPAPTPADAPEATDAPEAPAEGGTEAPASEETPAA